MKTRKYEELNALKGKMRELKYTYRKLATETSMGLNTLNDKLNGYSIFTADEAALIASILHIPYTEFAIYFFPVWLRNATNDGIA